MLYVFRLGGARRHCNWPTSKVRPVPFTFWRSSSVYSFDTYYSAKNKQWLTFLHFPYKSNFKFHVKMKTFVMSEISVQFCFIVLQKNISYASDFVVDSASFWTGSSLRQYTRRGVYWYTIYWTVKSILFHRLATAFLINISIWLYDLR